MTDKKDKKTGKIINFIKKLKKDKKIVKVAIKKDAFALQFADKSLLNDNEIQNLASKTNNYILKYIGKLN